MIAAGWATRSIVPDRPALVQGQMHRRVARRPMDDLTVTALALAGGRPRDAAIVISCDLALISDELQLAVRRRLKKALPSVPSPKIFLAATHTHTSLVCEDGCYVHPGGNVMTPAECTAFVADRAAAAAVAAWQARVPSRVASAFGHAVVAQNRRAVYADGSAVMYGRTDHPDFVGIEGGA
ncbi:hypothetical protein HQ590_05225, partial [bacterium]|nr:hypothetical protein [bacterium]